MVPKDDAPVLDLAAHLRTREGVAVSQSGPPAVGTAPITNTGKTLPPANEADT